MKKLLSCSDAEYDDNQIEGVHEALLSLDLMGDHDPELKEVMP